MTNYRMVSTIGSADTNIIIGIHIYYSLPNIYCILSRDTYCMVRVTPLFSFYRGNLTVLCSYLCIINECTSIFEDLSGFHDAASQEEESRSSETRSEIKISTTCHSFYVD